MLPCFIIHCETYCVLNMSSALCLLCFKRYTLYVSIWRGQKWSLRYLGTTCRLGQEDLGGHPHPLSPNLRGNLLGPGVLACPDFPTLLSASVGWLYPLDLESSQLQIENELFHISLWVWYQLRGDKSTCEDFVSYLYIQQLQSNNVTHYQWSTSDSLV